MREATADVDTDGLTKREYFSALLLQGLLAEGGWRSEPVKDTAAIAVAYADALLEELAKP